MHIYRKGLTRLGSQYSRSMHLPCASPVHGRFPARWTRLFFWKPILLRAIWVRKTSTQQPPPRSLANGRVKRPRKGPKVSELLAALLRLAWLEPRQTLKWTRNVTNRSCRNCIFHPKGLTRRSRRVLETPLRVPTQRIPEWATRSTRSS